MHCEKPRCRQFLQAALLSGGLAATLPCIAGGQTAAASDPPSLFGDSWRVELGANVGLHPVYPGATRYGPTADPDITLSYRHRVTFGREGLSLNILSVPGLALGPVIGLMDGRDHKDSARLDGMGDIQPSLALGAFLRWQHGPFTIRATVRQAATHSRNGLKATLGGEWRTPIASDLTLALGPDLDFGNGRYEQTWFGVTQAQAASSGLPAYHAGGGLQDAGAHVRLTWQATPRWQFRTFAGFRQLLLDAAGSPIVQRQTMLMAGVGAGYRF